MSHIRVLSLKKGNTKNLVAFMAYFSVSKVRKRRLLKSLYCVRACVQFKLPNQLTMFAELSMEVETFFSISLNQ